MNKIIIVSNRLPVKLITSENGNFEYKNSEGGLATGLNAIRKNSNIVWIGWPGTVINDDKQRNVNQDLQEMQLIPVFLTQDEINHYYEGFSNETLWPIFHYMATYARYEQHHYAAYKEVNRKFKEAVLRIYNEGDTIWIHDYQLLLLPSMLRQDLPDATIGFFQHIPFPSYELFRLIPWRKELLHGLMGADLIGFHTYDDVRHFLSTVTHLLPVRSSANMVFAEERTVVVESFPMGIDPSIFENALNKQEVKEHIQNLQSTFTQTKIILTIDRLDYSKGIIQRLQAFDLFLHNDPEYLEKVVLYMVIVPSRDAVKQYRELRDEIDQLVGRINARYRTMTWLPIHYFYRSFSHDMLVALYNSADVCLVTPMRDGMNLVCKEYVACRTQNNGVLILSEMAGASKELVDAIIVNPNNTEEIYTAIKEALQMPPEEQEPRMKQMRQLIQQFNIRQWAKIFMERLKEVKELQASMQAKYVNYITAQVIKNRYKQAERRAIFLDYDGTLVGFQRNIEKASPDAELIRILTALCNDELNRVVVISGRDHHTLGKWFSNLRVDLIAEHGAWKKINGMEWESIPGLNDNWKKEIMPVLQTYTDRTPGTFIEEKDFSLVWHFRKADEGLAELRANELMTNLRYLAADRGLQLLPGNKIIEIKNIEINKGRAVASWMQLNNDPEFVLAIGDDHTDEDIFKSLPETATTIKVGSNISAARYYLNSYTDVRRFLENLCS